MYFSAAVRRAAVRSSVPYFVFTHGALDPWFQRRYPHKQAKKAAYWLLFEHKVMRDAAAVLFTTEEERLLSRGAFWPYQCKEQVTGYGIADPALAPGGSTDFKQAKQALNCAFPALASRKFLLFLARIHEKKGIDILLYALANCREQFRDHALVIAGPGQDNYVMELKRLAARLGISRDLVWTGPLYREMKWAAIRSAEAYILPSHQENFGISVVEALACGVPVLITDKVNIWREVLACRAGFAESDNVAGITRLLKKWAEQPTVQIASMHTNARRCFCNQFDVVKTSSNLFALLEQHIN
jgi:glycosyltransferase involved in cell wall biosynthesis